ncbi:MAG TPA: hypothetical protein VNH11_34680 [Pirellulales bacterium]|nr:hypothetical protein [Pirellulales bacterium]
MDIPRGREKLIKGITTGFAFFALVVLVTESLMVGAAVMIEEGWDRTFLFVSSVSLLTLLSVLVALLLRYRPWVLTGEPQPKVKIRRISPPPYTETTVPVQYFLRGIRESYLHVLADARLAPPSHLRLNVMLVLPAAGKKTKDKALKIKHVDYAGLYSTDELLQEYPIGVGNCGEAWRLLVQRAWASDLSEAERVDMKDVTSPTAQSRNSVLSSPVMCAGECVGVLNLDSDEDSKATHVQLPMIQNLLEQAAQEIVPLLFPAVRKVAPHDAG